MFVIQPEASTSRLPYSEQDASHGSGIGDVTGPGTLIANAQDWMRGHGTFVRDNQVYSSVAGTIERVNKLVSVKALRTRYARPEVGDLVIGRIVEVGPRRWKVEANSTQHAVLMLSSINLPGGVQRRKLESDELQMRSFFSEGDLLVAEVQAFFGDGAMSLHTRSLRYGKLRNGTLVTVPPALIVRSKSHFHTLPFGVDLIIGLNGFIWVSKTTKETLKANADSNGASVSSAGASFADESGEAVYSSQNEDIPNETRTAIARTVSVVSILAQNGVPMSIEAVEAAYKASLLTAGEGQQGVRKLQKPEQAQQLMRALTLGSA